MSLRRIMVYALSGEEYKGGRGSGFVGTMIDCLFNTSLEPFREYTSLLRKKITQERLQELYKGEMNG